MAKTKLRKKAAFDIEKYLSTAGVARTMAKYRAGETIFSQGGPCESVLYLRQGAVKLVVTSSAGKEAVIAILHPGEFFGEESMGGRGARAATATAMEPACVLSIEKGEMIRVLHEEHPFSDRFVSHLLKRHASMEGDLEDQLFNSSEKRLARVLLLLAKYGREEQPEKTVANISQEMLAEMVGTTRSRVNFFMNKFRKLGYIKYNGGLQINGSLLRAVLHG
ncbi:MAG TPA: Crp/Fnr family transcriptional regulator [Candidatus Acidoferrales bacterium]|nr:Crp/Fnr family transcriptional regulator [Candidatus Acidoferrales bacterium]